MAKIHPTAIIAFFIISNIVCLVISNTKSPIVIVAKSLFLFIPTYII